MIGRRNRTAGTFVDHYFVCVLELIINTEILVRFLQSTINRVIARSDQNAHKTRNYKDITFIQKFDRSLTTSLIVVFEIYSARAHKPQR